MNDARRKVIQRALTLIGEAKSILEVALSQEQDDLDNMPEDLQGDEEGQIAEDMVDALERAAMGCGDAITACKERCRVSTSIGDEMREDYRCRYWASNPVLNRSDGFRLAPGFR